MEIGSVVINNPVILAPMAGVTDYPYRQIVREMGCQLVYTEMVSSKGLVYQNQKTEELIEFAKDEGGYIAVQLFGEEPASMAEAAAIVARKYKPDIIDINMGCPTPKIVKNGSGSALMKTPSLAAKVISSVVEAVNLPVTVKIRKGWDAEQINAVEIAQLAEQMGAQAVAVHGRTREQFYSGQADWEIIREVKNAVAIPVIGNGDIFSPELAGKMVEETKCDGVMIGRGAQGNPWLLMRTTHYLRTGELLPEPDYREIIKMILYHLQLSMTYYGEKIAIPKMRKHIGWYLKGLPNSTGLKDKINKLTDSSKIEKMLLDYLMELEG